MNGHNQQPVHRRKTPVPAAFRAAAASNNNNNNNNNNSICRAPWSPKMKKRGVEVTTDSHESTRPISNSHTRPFTPSNHFVSPTGTCRQAERTRKLTPQRARSDGSPPSSEIPPPATTAAGRLHFGYERTAVGRETTSDSC